MARSRGDQGAQEKMISLMREILQEQYLELEVESYVLQEEVARGRCCISCKMRNGHEAGMVVEGEGVGVIDALFHGLRDRMATQYPSLSSIRFSQFDIHGIIAAHEQQGRGSAERGAGDSWDRQQRGQGVHLPVQGTQRQPGRRDGDDGGCRILRQQRAHLRAALRDPTALPGGGAH